MTHQVAAPLLASDPGLDLRAQPVAGLPGVAVAAAAAAAAQAEVLLAVLGLVVLPAHVAFLVAASPAVAVAPARPGLLLAVVQQPQEHRARRQQPQQKRLGAMRPAQTPQLLQGPAGQLLGAALLAQTAAPLLPVSPPVMLLCVCVLMRPRWLPLAVLVVASFAPVLPLSCQQLLLLRGQAGP